MSFNFPNSPSTNDTYTFGGKTWVYTAKGAWQLQTAALSTTVVAEGANLYYTNVRAREALSVIGGGSYDTETGVITINDAYVLSVGGSTSSHISNTTIASAVVTTGLLTTDNVSELTNQYFTNARAIAAFTEGSGINIDSNGLITSSVSGGVSSVNSATGDVVLTTANIAEDSNLYFTNARVYSNVTGLGYITTSSLNGYATNGQLASYATTTHVSNEVANLINSAPSTLDTLNELAVALGNDSNFSTTVATSIGNAFNKANTALLAGQTAFDKANLAYQSLTTANVAELTNLYYTDDRVNTFVHSGSIDYVRFSNVATSPTYAEGKLFYDSSSKSLSYYLDNPDITLNIGQEEITRVYNNTGSTLLNGKAVIITGAYNGVPTIDYGYANTISRTDIVGMLTANVSDSSYGYITARGVVHDVVTTGIASGSPVYLSPDTPGGITVTKPTLPDFVVELGYTTEGNSATGAIYFAPFNSAFENLTVGDLGVTGNTSLIGDVSIDGAATFTSNVSIDKDLTVYGNINFSGNVTQLSGNYGVFYGDAYGVGAIYGGLVSYTPLPNTVLQLTADVDLYAQFNFQNLSNDPLASSDIVLTGDDGTDESRFIDLGIASSTYDYVGYEIIPPNAGYLNVVSGDLVQYTQTPGTDIVFYTGGSTTTVDGINDGFTYANAQLRLADGSGVKATANYASTSNTTGSLVVFGGLGVTGNVNLTTVTGGLWQGSSISTDYTDAKVTSVNGQTGSVDGLTYNTQLSAYALDADLTSDNVIELTSLYFTNARAIAAFTEGSGISIDANGLISSTATASGGVTSVTGATGDVSNTQILSGLLTVDGDGSTLDADLLDGQHGSYYLNRSNHTGDITLGANTVGDYLSNVLAGTGIEVTGQGGETATPTVALSTSGVVASTYGSDTVVPVITVDAYGRVTSASNVTITSSGGGGGGGGDFNTAINSATGYTVTSSLAAAYTAAATSGHRYIVRSLQVVNISAATANITGDFSGTKYSSVNFANSIPLPAGTAIELFRRPKIVEPSDILRLQSSVDSALHATITIEDATSTTHFGAGTDISNSDTYNDVYTANAASVIESVYVCNDGGGTAEVTVTWTNSSDTIQGYFCYKLPLPRNSAIEILEAPKYIASGYKIRAKTTLANTAEVIVAGKTAT